MRQTRECPGGEALKNLPTRRQHVFGNGVLNSMGSFRRIWQQCEVLRLKLKQQLKVMTNARATFTGHISATPVTIAVKIAASISIWYLMRNISRFLNRNAEIRFIAFDSEDGLSTQLLTNPSEASCQSWQNRH